MRLSDEFGGTSQTRCVRAALGEAARFIFVPVRSGKGLTKVSDEEAVKAEPLAVEPAREAELAEILKALREIVSELKDVNTSLRAIARSQAHQATQKRPQNS